MVSRFHRATLIALCLLVIGGAARAQSRPPIEAFASLPFISAPHLSPDGAHFAAIQSYQGRPVVAVYKSNASKGEHPVVLQTPGIASEVFWVNNAWLIVVARSSGSYFPSFFDDKPTPATFWQTFSVSIDGKSTALLGAGPLNTIRSQLVQFDSSRPNSIIYPVISEGHINLFQGDVVSGRSNKLFQGASDTSRWILDGHGSVVARIASARDGSYEEVETDANLFTAHTVARVESGDSMLSGVEGLMDDGVTLAFSRMGPDGTRGLYPLNLQSGAIGPALFQNANYDLNQVILDEHTGRVIGVTWQDDRREFEYFDSTLERHEESLLHAFPGMSVGIVSSNADRSVLIVSVEGPQNPLSFYYLETQTMHASPLGSTYPQLSESNLGVRTPLVYKARDGVEIHAYLTLPPGTAPRNLPTVIFPHGGPDDRDDAGFDWWAQFMANRGYAVLQPNFRGSSGYGERFTKLGFRQWGLRMQDDVTDGVYALIALGIADPKRVCIVGASYGGYAALAGATMTPDLYVCAVSVSGLSNLEEWLAADDYSAMNPEKKWWQLRLGSVEEDRDRLRGTSPSLLADRVKCPILLIHSEEDRTVPYGQSVIMNNALVRAKKNVRFVTLHEDDHYLGLAATRARVLKEVEDFLDATIGSKVATIDSTNATKPASPGAAPK